MDVSLRDKLLGGFVGVVAAISFLTIVAGGYFINQRVIGEAQRRVELGLKTAHAMLERRLEEAYKSSLVIAEGLRCQEGASLQAANWQFPHRLKARLGYDFLYLVKPDGSLLATANGNTSGRSVFASTVLSRTLRWGVAAAGVCLVPLSEIDQEGRQLAERARIEVLPTLRAKPGGYRPLTHALVLQAAAPVFDERDQLKGAVCLGTVLNGNFDFVDFVRENVFTIATYRGKNLGTVTLFQDDVRIATNVVGPDGRRAVGTRVSAEVYDRVLGKGQMWIGPAFVVDSWYISAYEPLRDLGGKIIGMLYVGVLKDRYDDMRNQALGLFVAVSILALVGAVLVSNWLAARLTRPLVQLTLGAAQVARGNLNYQLPVPPRAERDEIKRLTTAFTQMIAALKERDEEVRSSHDKLSRTAQELQEWMQNYLETLEFITHELKNQVAAMKINLLAVHDGYVGEITPDQKEALDDVVQAINRAEEMILNYLNLSRIEKGDLQIRARPVHVETDVVRPVLRDLRGRIEAKGMQVQVELPEDLMVQADPSLLQIVYANLLSNAAKYGRPGGQVRVWGSRLNGTAELHVWNDGPGVRPEQLGELFQKFRRLQAAGEQERGTGLGLFITRELVRRHGGDVRAESAYGEWIDFIFALPVPDALR